VEVDFFAVDVFFVEAFGFAVLAGAFDDADFVVEVFFVVDFFALLAAGVVSLSVLFEVLDLAMGTWVDG
jgi:hypothetical protein